MEVIFPAEAMSDFTAFTDKGVFAGSDNFCWDLELPLSVTEELHVDDLEKLISPEIIAEDAKTFAVMTSESSDSKPQDLTHHDVICHDDVCHEETVSCEEEHSPADSGVSFTENSPQCSVDSSMSPSQTDSYQNKTYRVPLLPPCRVCGEKASGLHYGVNTCEACKGFFRRSLQRKDQYRCLVNQNCDISIGRRNICAHCRYVKCVAVGMSKNAIKTGRYTHQKRTRDITEVKSLQQAQNGFPAEGSLDKIHSNITDTRQQEIAQFIEQLTRSTAQMDPQGASLWVDTEEKLREAIENCKLKQEVLGQTEPISKDEFKKFKETTGLELDNRLDIISHWTAMIEAGIKKLVNYAKAIPGFTSLTLKDQSSLIKASRFEVGMVSLQRRFSCESSCFTGIHGRTMHKTEMWKVWDRDYVESLFLIAKKMQEFHLSYPESVLLMGVILTFNDRCELDNPASVEAIQERMVAALGYSLLVNHSHVKNKLAKTLLFLVELRELSEWNTKVVEAIRLDWPDVDYPPLICELFA